MAVPVVSGDRVIGAVRLTYPTQVVTDKVRGQLRILWLVAGITVLLAGAVAFVLRQPRSRVACSSCARTTELLAEGQLDARAPEPGGAPEIRSLARSVNQMADRLDDLLRQQRAFAGDASHQLRTPLTALRVRLDNAADLVDADPDAARDTIAAAQDEALRLQRIVDALLMLSRADDAAIWRRRRSTSPRWPARGSNSGSRSPRNPGCTSP